MNNQDFVNLTLDVNDLNDRQLLIVLIGEIRQTNAHLRNLSGAVDVHGAQLNELNKWRWLTTGGLIVVSIAILPLVLDFVGIKIK